MHDCTGPWPYLCLIRSIRAWVLPGLVTQHLQPPCCCLQGSVYGGASFTSEAQAADAAWELHVMLQDDLPRCLPPPLQPLHQPSWLHDDAPPEDAHADTQPPELACRQPAPPGGPQAAASLPGW